MKKIFTLIASITISTILNAQILDTVRIRNLTLQAQDVAWLVGKLGEGTDSTQKDAFRRVRAAVLAANPQTWTTSITLDSIPGAIVFSMYKAVKSHAAEAISRYTAITTAISAKTILSPWLQAYDATLQADFIRFRDLGKSSVLDKTNGQ